MTTTSNKQKLNTKKVTVISVGLLLVFGWALVLAISTLRTDLACWMSPNDCGLTATNARAILFAPIVLGSLIVPIGFIYDKNISPLLKLVIACASATVLYFLAFWIIVFVGIGIHGI